MLASARATALSASVLIVSAASAVGQTTETFTFTGSIDNWSAPQAGDYRIVAIGAQGASADPDHQGGRGARIEGTFTLSAGEVFRILVGGAGTAGAGDGGGGGGTFFVRADDIPFLIAGGGGGTRAVVDQDGTDASTAEAAFTASGSGTTYTPVLKTTDIGAGGVNSSGSWGSGGGGFFGAGQPDPICGTASAGGGDWASGMEGGNGASTSGPGGFGGGGSGDGCNGGGGGGGYSGGDGGRVAGGGGSFNAGSDQVAIAGVGLGDGLLQIIYLLILGPTTDEEIARLTAAASVTGRVVVLDARELSRMRGRDSLVTRDKMLSFTRVADPETGSLTVSQSTMGHPSMIGNLYTWLDLTGFRAEDDDAGRNYSGRGIQIGADLALSRDMVAGLSFGVQDLDASVGAFSQDGVLRFVQPYLAYRSGAWSGEASIIYGHGDYDQSSDGGDGKGETRLAALTFTGGYNMALGQSATLTPVLGFAHGVEEVEGLSGTLEGAGTETVRFTEVSLGADIRKSLSGGEVFAGLHADWLNTSSDTALVSDLLVDDGWTGRLDLGVSTELVNGLELETSVELSGIGGDLRQTSGAVRFGFRF